MHPRRALLYVPGDDRHKIEKALTFGVDSICMDMEDAVALNHKVDARLTIARALQELFFKQSEKLVRINPVGSGMEKEDLQAILPQHPDGIVMPKIESLAQIQWVHARLETAELDYGWPINSIRLLVGVETPKAILNLKEIASHPRLDALIFGGEDFAAALGATRTREAAELMYARQAILTAAAAFGLQAIDIVNVDFGNLEAVREEALAGARLGFTGKQIIHPGQVEPVQSAFTPNDEAIQNAKKIIAAFESHQKAGQGVFAVDGRMIDMPIVKNAQKVLERAKAAGKL